MMCKKKMFRVFGMLTTQVQVQGLGCCSLELRGQDFDHVQEENVQGFGMLTTQVQVQGLGC